MAGISYSTAQKLIGVSYFRSFFSRWDGEISVSLSASHFNLQWALGAINRQHFILPVITQIHLYTLLLQSLCRMTKWVVWTFFFFFFLQLNFCAGSLTGEAMGCFVERKNGRAWGNARLTAVTEAFSAAAEHYWSHVRDVSLVVKEADFKKAVSPSRLNVAVVDAWEIQCFFFLLPQSGKNIHVTAGNKRVGNKVFTLWAFKT